MAPNVDWTEIGYTKARPYFVEAFPDTCNIR